MMDIKTLFLLLVFSLPFTCNAISSAGVVSINPDREVFLYSPNKMANGDFVQFQYQSQNGEKKCCINLTSKSFRQVESDTIVSDADGNAIFRYKLITKPKFNISTTFLSIAIIGKKTKVEQINANTLKVGAKNDAFIVSTCTSLEGQHFVSKIRNQVVSDLYYYLSYEIEQSNCL